MSKDHNSPDSEKQKNIQHKRSMEEAAEQNLWDLDGIDFIDAPFAETPPTEKRQLPTPRQKNTPLESQKPKVKPTGTPFPARQNRHKAVTNITAAKAGPGPASKPGEGNESSGKTDDTPALEPFGASAPPGSDLGAGFPNELDSIVTEEPDRNAPPASKEITPAKRKASELSFRSTVSRESHEEKESRNSPETDQTPATAEQEEKDITVPPSELSEPTPTNAKSLVSRTIASLSSVEKKATIALLAVLLLSSFLLVAYISERASTSQGAQTGELQLPVVGDDLTVTAVNTFWREPVTTGESRDIVRHGTKLIPVVTMKLESDGKPTALRVLFRDSFGNSIGDPINRTVASATSISLAATAGFDDTGMHAAYRTGESPPWTVEVLQGPDINAASDRFTLLFETLVTTNIR